MRDQLAHLPFGSRRFADAPLPVRVGVTGTGPDLLVLAWSAPALARERAAGVRLLRRLGLAPGMRIANTLPGALATPGSLLLGDVVEELGGLDVPLGVVEGAAAARQAWELLERVRPEVVVLDDASAPHLFAAVSAGRLDWWQGIVWLGVHEVGSAEPHPAAIRPDTFAGWERTWLAVPEATSFVAGSCPASRHHADEGVVVEVVEETTAAVRPPGEVGVLALTPLGGDLPLVRYATAIRARAVDGCPCGAGGAVLEIA